MTIFYEVYGNLYLNLTNKCPCACNFCVRNEGDGIEDVDNLWLEYEPTIEEVKNDFENFKECKYDEIVFCGFGEPLERIEDVVEIAKYLKTKTDKPIRINTNGLSDLIHGKKTANMLEGAIDIVSVSLNAPDAKTYQQRCNSSFGEKSYQAMLDFTEDCKKYVPKVILSVVDVIGKEEIEECRKIADQIGVEYRVREFI